MGCTKASARTREIHAMDAGALVHHLPTWKANAIRTGFVTEKINPCINLPSSSATGKVCIIKSSVFSGDFHRPAEPQRNKSSQLSSSRTDLISLQSGGENLCPAPLLSTEQIWIKHSRQSCIHQEPSLPAWPSQYMQKGEFDTKGSSAIDGSIPSIPNIRCR